MKIYKLNNRWWSHGSSFGWVRRKDRRKKSIEESKQCSERINNAKNEGKDLLEGDMEKLLESKNCKVILSLVEPDALDLECILNGHTEMVNGKITC
jgi:hypothetical protein